MEFDRPKGVEMHLDIAPLIDIVFMLLLFFMLTSSFVTDNGIELNLPQAETGKIQEESEPVVIYIDQDQRIFLDKETFELEQLEKSLAEKLKNSQLKKVVLKSDEAVPMGFVVKVMDIARQAKGENLIISTRKVEGVMHGEE
ncbi:biopolymer transporter ExbD [Halocella sp. SP3-1]|uniref:ExbD/TolR family protein n=1 Tax=Halocella sp. SP3-1 TaxID=2382161 RepID=UPI000F75AEF7|nr:biopolymer transporter ExbD [Halocella sp. SP3-1]AZO95972.1 biopolymer transporter ExbD [Halocella sp. SP3-1]